MHLLELQVMRKMQFMNPKRLRKPSDQWPPKPKRYFETSLRHSCMNLNEHEVTYFRRDPGNKDASPQVLVATSDPALRDELRELLPGHELITVGTAIDAVFWLKGREFDALLVDRRVPAGAGESPGQDGGVDLLDWVRANRRRRWRSSRSPLPAILLSPFQEECSLHFALDHGPSDSILLPIQADEFSSRFKRAARGDAGLLPLEPKDVWIEFRGIEGKQVWVELLPEPLKQEDAQLLRALVPAWRASFQEGRLPADYEWTTPAQLRAMLEDWNGEPLQEQSLRARVLRFRDRMQAEFRDQLRRTQWGDDIVQSRQGEGYRLNPFLVRVAVTLPQGAPRWCDQPFPPATETRATLDCA